MTQNRLPWLIAAVAVSAGLILLIAPYRRGSIPTESRFPLADGVSVRVETIDLSPTTKLNVRYSPISDDGVELDLVTDGKRIWEAFAKPLEVEHSWYEHTVKCALVDGQVVLLSSGTYGSFIEHRNLKTGDLINRETFPKRPEPAASPQPSSEVEIQGRIDGFREQTNRSRTHNAPNDGLRGFSSEPSTDRPR